MFEGVEERGFGPRAAVNSRKPEERGHDLCVAEDREEHVAVAEGNS